MGLLAILLFLAPVALGRSLFHFILALCCCYFVEQLLRQPFVLCWRVVVVLVCLALVLKSDRDVPSSALVAAHDVGDLAELAQTELHSKRAGLTLSLIHI